VRGRLRNGEEKGRKTWKWRRWLEDVGEEDWKMLEERDRRWFAEEEDVRSSAVGVEWRL